MPSWNASSDTPLAAQTETNATTNETNRPVWENIKECINGYVIEILDC